MPDKHTELEYKVEADEVDNSAFIKWVMTKEPTRYEHIYGPDLYYHQGDHVIRHRWSGGPGELTVKRRKSADNTFDREEIDLHFADDTNLNDITSFLQATGWKREFTIFKDAHIFWFERNGITISVVIYEAGRLHEQSGDVIERAKFIEVEVEKGSNISNEHSQSILDEWLTMIRNRFPIGKPVNFSLYELYSGKRYTLTEKNDGNQSSVCTGVDRRSPDRKPRRLRDDRGDRANQRGSAVSVGRSRSRSRKRRGRG